MKEVSATRVWDLPLRLFHWALVVLIIVSVVSVNIGGNAMEIHELSGSAILALVLFRILWGFVGGHHARFTSFVRGPVAVAQYLRRLRAGDHAHPPGHNPLGAWSVLAMLTCVLVQAVTGLFSNDDIMMDGPLVKWITKDLSDAITRVHHLNSKVLLALVVLHLAAIVFHAAVLKERLVGAMWNGGSTVSANPVNESSAAALLVRAAALLGVCAAAVFWLVR